MSPYDDAATALFEAIEPVAAYCERTARPNRHADQLDQLITAVADFGAAADEAIATREAAPDWQALAYRLAARVEMPPSPPCPLITRCRALLDSPRVQANAALPLPQRLLLASITSHDLPLPEGLADFLST